MPNLGPLITLLAIIAAVSIPFAIWKWVEIILWLASHISFS